MQLSNYLEIRNGLQLTVLKYYRARGREARYFLESKDEEWGWVNLHFLIDRRHVVRYGFGIDRDILRGGISLGIGPHYFGPDSFWSYEDSLKFSHTLDDDSVFRNLRLMDEFWKISDFGGKISYQVT